MIDDDEDDCMVFKMALAETNRDVKFIYLHSCDGMATTIQETNPDLIFLDINLPRANGLECLEQIKQAPNSENIPVVMYSSSELPKDLAAAYEKGAALFFRKPNNINDLIDALKDILQMSWHRPENIKAQYYKAGRYFVYENKRLV
jgi:CheY-like chemotaxis protein